MEAYIRLRMKIYEKNKWIDTSLKEYFREHFSNVSDNQFKTMNGDRFRKFRDYLRGHVVYILKGKNIHIYTALAQGVTE